MQHLQPHMTLYIDDIFNWGENSERKVESLMMILSYPYLASLSPPYIVTQTRLL